MNVYIVEDDIFHLDDIMITLQTLGHSCIGNSNDPFEAQEEIGKLMPDAVLLDIHLNRKQSGITLGKRIKSLYKIPILFISSDYTVDVMSKAADISPIAYITKPINEKNLQAALILAQKSISKDEKNREDSSRVFVKSGNKLIKVEMNTIFFIHTDSKNYCSIVTSDNKKLSVRYSILSLLKLLDNTIFVQTHRSYIVNWQKIDSFHEPDQTIEIKGHHIPIGRTFKGEVYKKLNII
ncbi:LytTR family DNA-binding domain-containing protein [Aquimarina sp. AU58]|uniref:LytR/AlgR family response regulator transcription factor n=1 Tax=Aquimarina sp. AU58 TaxID=1874112 RepID=UPI000D648542|nr:response regulator transcription factor [Aquimarina sp. AU58]